MLLCDQYITPLTLQEALAQWAQAPEGSRLVTGGTDLLPWAREGRAGDVHLPMLIDLSRIDQMSGTESQDGRIRMGANTVFQQFLVEKELRRDLPCMPYCAVWFADDQIRQQATLAGNLVNASPAADGTAPMLALNGEIEIARLEDGNITRRSLPVADFVQGPGKVDLKPDEIVTAVTCDALTGYGGAFEKVGQRRSLVISTVCATCMVKPSADETTFQDVRLSMAGIGPVPVRLAHIETFLSGKPISRSVIRDAAAMSDGLVNSRTRRTYRKHVVEGFIERSLLNALSDCGVELAQEDNREMAHA